AGDFQSCNLDALSHGASGAADLGGMPGHKEIFKAFQKLFRPLERAGRSVPGTDASRKLCTTQRRPQASRWTFSLRS
ncbi:MAG: hypothetical protein AAGI70_11275, partial [Pseudomonadota bacterium]